jgi:hypothetical protein
MNIFSLFFIVLKKDFLSFQEEVEGKVEVLEQPWP